MGLHHACSKMLWAPRALLSMLPGPPSNRCCHLTHVAQSATILGIIQHRAQVPTGYGRDALPTVKPAALCPS